MKDIVSHSTAISPFFSYQESLSLFSLSNKSFQGDKVSPQAEWANDDWFKPIIHQDAEEHEMQFWPRGEEEMSKDFQ